MKSLAIKNLHVNADTKEILKGIDFVFETGKTYAIIGPNGQGKSTLLSAIMGDPNYEVTSGEILLDEENLINCEVDERSTKGIYLLMQYPSEIEGISNINLLTNALEKHTNQKMSQLSVYADAQQIASALNFNNELIDRDVNVGFSGGEKKKNELMHLFMLKPTFAFLDEVDSGLDVDSIESVANLINKHKNENQSFIVVSHYKKLYELIKPDEALVIKGGKISRVLNYDQLINVLDKGFYNE